MNKLTEEVSDIVDLIKLRKPLIHNITNYVTANDCANAVLAIGASPIMADDICEVSDITAISSALVINIGTLNGRTLESMLCSAKKANDLGIPVIFDPVGAGASVMRNEATETILSKVRVSAVRGNLSEISFVAGLGAHTKGVDVSEKDTSALNNKDIALAASKKLDCIAAITGETDVVSDGKRLAVISNGNKMLSSVTGTGCMTTALAGAFLGAAGDTFAAVAGGIAAMGIAGEMAFEAAGGKGTGSFHIAVIDAISRLTKNVFLERAKIDEI